MEKDFFENGFNSNDDSLEFGAGKEENTINIESQGETESKSAQQVKQSNVQDELGIVLPTIRQTIEEIKEEGDKQAEDELQRILDGLADSEDEQAYRVGLELQKGIPECEFWIKQLIQKAEEGDMKFAAFHGGPGTHKSMIATQLLISMVSGVPFLFNDEFAINKDLTQQHPYVMLLPLEDSRTKVLRRFESQYDAFVRRGCLKAEDKAKILGRIVVLSEKVVEEVLSGDWRKVMKYVREIEPSAFVVDNLSDLFVFGGKEVYTPAGMGETLMPMLHISKQMSLYGGIEYVLAHDTKESGSPLGSQVLRALSNPMVQMKEDPQIDGNYIMEITKANDIEKGKFSLCVEHPLLLLDKTAEVRKQEKLDEEAKREKEYKEMIQLADKYYNIEKRGSQDYVASLLTKMGYTQKTGGELTGHYLGRELNKYKGKHSTTHTNN